MSKCKKTWLLYKRNPLKVIIGLYFGLIILFGFVYYLLWFFNPENFTVNDNFNQNYEEELSLSISALKSESSNFESIEENKIVVKSEIENLKNARRLLIVEKYLPLRKKLTNTIAKMKDDVSSPEAVSMDAKIRQNLNIVFQNEGITQVLEDNRDFGVKKELNAKTEKPDIRDEKLFNHVASSDTVIFIKLRDSIGSVRALLESTNQKSNITPEEKKVRQSLSTYIDEFEEIRKKILSLLEGEIMELTREINQKTVKLLDVKDLIYFSFITASTTGYGEIVPNSAITRALTVAEIILATFLFAMIFFELGAMAQKTTYISEDRN